METQSYTTWGVGNTLDSPGNTTSPHTGETPYISQSDTEVNPHQTPYHPLQHPKEQQHPSKVINNIV